MHYLISPSEFRVHKECTQKHEYIYGQGLRPISRDRKMEFGSYWHELAHFYYQLLQSGYKVGDIHTIAAMDAKLNRDLEEVDKDYFDTLARVHIVFRRYLERWTEVIDTGIEILEVEKHIIYEDENEDIGIHGVVDLIYRDRKGQLVIRDHKTGEKKASHSLESLEVEDQLLTYAAVVWKQTGELPAIEISWINSKPDYKTLPTNDQLYGIYKMPLTRQWLEGFWNYTMRYVNHMQTVPVIPSMNSWKCKSCPFKDACVFSIKGLDNGNILKSNFKVVPRSYDYAKFTEIARKKAVGNSNSQSGGDSSSRFSINFIKREQVET